MSDQPIYENLHSGDELASPFPMQKKMGSWWDGETLS